MSRAGRTSVAAPFSSAAQQEHAARLGMWVFLATELMFFGPLFIGYLYARLQFPASVAAASRHTALWLGTGNTALLLSSSAATALATLASHGVPRRTTAAWLGLAAALGAVFLVVKGIEYRQEWREHLFPGPRFAFHPRQHDGAELFFIIYFAATALHALHLIVAIAMVLTLAAASLRAAAWLRPEHVAIGALYWHFVDVVWIFLYPMLYLAGGAR